MLKITVVHRKRHRTGGITPTREYNKVMKVLGDLLKVGKYVTFDHEVDPDYHYWDGKTYDLIHIKASDDPIDLL